MIKFEKLAINDIVVTLTEKSTLSNPIYLWEFKNDQSNDLYYFVGTDTSQFKQRYNQFQIEDKAANPNTLAGQTSLGNEGFYNYTVYETSLSNLNGKTTALQCVPFIIGTVEVGLVWVVPNIATVDAYVPALEQITVYQPE